MAERPVHHELAPKKTLADQVQAIFERRATKGERKLILETYETKFDALLQKLPKEQQENIMVKIQKVLTTIRGVFSEYGARITDFARKVFLWPMIAADKDFPKDKYYQIELARAKAWGEFAKDTTKTATAERTAYRDHFASTVVSHAQVLGAGGAIGMVGLGVAEGAKIGAVAGLGLQGAAVGAIAGGILGGAYSFGLFVKDKIVGPPVVYYDVFAGAGKRGVSIDISQQVVQKVPATTYA
ncbi:MAG: hypothetical protein ACOY3M_01280 [Patescibacteria group bacterium]